MKAASLSCHSAGCRLPVTTIQSGAPLPDLVRNRSIKSYLGLTRRPEKCCWGQRCTVLAAVPPAHEATKGPSGPFLLRQSISSHGLAI